MIKNQTLRYLLPKKMLSRLENRKEKRNIPSGFTKFAKQEILNQENYVQNGKLFLKIITDTANMYHP